jgi:hypothetical protein
LDGGLDGGEVDGWGQVESAEKAFCVEHFVPEAFMLAAANGDDVVLAEDAVSDGIEVVEGVHEDEAVVPCQQAAVEEGVGRAVAFDARLAS